MAVDRESTSWLAVKAHCEKQIEGLRDQLERHQAEEMASSARGQIAALRAVLKLGDTRPEIADSPDFY